MTVTAQKSGKAGATAESISNAHEVFEARELLEPRTARSAAQNATPDDVALLSDHIAQEHAALDAGDRGRALYLSGKFHLEIARIANQKTVADMIDTLIARSSLIIALYWRRESALCESQAHHALIPARSQHLVWHCDPLPKHIRSEFKPNPRGTSCQSPKFTPASLAKLVLTSPRSRAAALHPAR